MTSRGLTWRAATEEDIPALREFECADPAPLQPFKGLRKPPAPPRPWEHVVQQGIRGMRPPPPANGEMMLIGEDAEGIAAVAWTERISGAGDVFVKAMAVALRLRRSAVYVGDALLDELQNRLAAVADAAGEPHLTISGKVDPKNRACKALLERFRWDTFDHDGKYEVWLTVVQLPN